LTELAGVPLLQPNDGLSLAGMLRHPATAIPYGPVFAEYGLTSRQPKYMVRSGEWKYSFWVHDIAELYNLRTDPAELHNLAAEPAYAVQVERMKQTLFAWHRPPEESGPRTQSSREK
jgi:choline-sulfatase